MYDERELLSNQEGCLPNDMLEVSITSIAYNIVYDTRVLTFLALFIVDCE